MRIEFSRLIFRVVVTVAVLGFAFLVGLFSAHRQNALYDFVYGTYADIRLVIKEIPNLRKTRPIHFLRKSRYDGDGITVNTFGDDDDSLVLLSGFFKDQNAVRLMKRNGTVVNEWKVRLFEATSDVNHCRNPPATEWNAIPHGTIIEPDGSIIFSFESCMMVKLDKCSKVEWVNEDLITHHSPNFTQTGGIVIAGGELVTPENRDIPWPYDGEYWEDFIFIFDKDGSLLKQKRLTELYTENGFNPVLTSNGNFKTEINGEFHLNEVEELSSDLAGDFPMFEAGDLLLSVRNRNLILVVDAAMEKIKWFHVGPWVRQHDPDFEPGGMITVFDNNTDRTDHGTVSGGSRIIEIDPVTNVTRVIYGGTPKQHMYSRERGTHQMQPGGGVLVTEAQGGRVFETDAAGNTVWEWVNRYDDENVTWMHDASVLPSDYFSGTDWSCS